LRFRAEGRAPPIIAVGGARIPAHRPPCLGRGAPL